MPTDHELKDIIDSARKKQEIKLRDDPDFAKAVIQTVTEKQLVECTVDEVRKAIFNRSIPPDQATFSFIPIEMTRLSPFFPISNLQKGKPDYVELKQENSWGRMTIKGIRLSIHDEDILLALCRLFEKKQVLTLVVSRSEICNAIGRGRGKNTHAAIDRTIERLTGTLVTIEVWDSIKTKNGMMKMGNTILTGYTITDKGKITVTLNPYFKEAYLNTMVTSIDVDFRMKLRHDVAKSLHRFLESQKQDYQIGIDKLIVAININPQQERRRIRFILKRGLNELREKNYLDFFNISKDDIVTIRKSTGYKTKVT